MNASTNKNDSPVSKNLSLLKERYRKEIVSLKEENERLKDTLREENERFKDTLQQMKDSILSMMETLDNLYEGISVNIGEEISVDRKRKSTQEFNETNVKRTKVHRGSSSKRKEIKQEEGKDREEIKKEYEDSIDQEIEEEDEDSIDQEIEEEDEGSQSENKYAEFVVTKAEDEAYQGESDSEMDDLQLTPRTSNAQKEKIVYYLCHISGKRFIKRGFQIEVEEDLMHVKLLHSNISSEKLENGETDFSEDLLEIKSKKTNCFASLQKLMDNNQSLSKPIPIHNGERKGFLEEMKVGSKCWVVGNFEIPGDRECFSIDERVVAWWKKNKTRKLYKGRIMSQEYSERETRFNNKKKRGELPPIEILPNTFDVEYDDGDLEYNVHSDNINSINRFFYPAWIMNMKGTYVEVFFPHDFSTRIVPREKNFKKKVFLYPESETDENLKEFPYQFLKPEDVLNFVSLLNKHFEYSKATKCLSPSQFAKDLTGLEEYQNNSEFQNLREIVMVQKYTRGGIKKYVRVFWDIIRRIENLISMFAESDFIDQIKVGLFKGRVTTIRYGERKFLLSLKSP